MRHLLRSAAVRRLQLQLLLMLTVYTIKLLLLAMYAQALLIPMKQYSQMADSINSATQSLKLISYNLHGYNQGRVGILELISKLGPDVIMVQEHWLTPDNLHKLDNISPDYFIFGSSAMNERVCAGPLYGRPFGGTAMLINKCHANNTHSLVSSDRYTAIKFGNILLVTVYFPCVGTPQRELICNDLLSELDALISANPNLN